MIRIIMLRFTRFCHGIWPCYISNWRSWQTRHFETKIRPNGDPNLTELTKNDRNFNCQILPIHSTDWCVLYIILKSSSSSSKWYKARPKLCAFGQWGRAKENGRILGFRPSSSGGATVRDATRASSSGRIRPRPGSDPFPFFIIFFLFFLKFIS